MSAYLFCESRDLIIIGMGKATSVRLVMMFMMPMVKSWA